MVSAGEENRMTRIKSLELSNVGVQRLYQSGYRAVRRAKAIPDLKARNGEQKHFAAHCGGRGAIFDTLKAAKYSKITFSVDNDAAKDKAAVEFVR